MCEKVTFGGWHADTLSSLVRARAGESDLKLSLPVSTSTPSQHLAQVWAHRSDLEIVIWR